LVSGKTRILVIDDNRSLVRLMEGVLQKAGYEVLTAYDGLEGLAKALNGKPNLIILDIIMPEMDGYEVCRRLQRHPMTASIPVLMLTVKGKVDQTVETAKQINFQSRVQDRNEAFDAGAVEFMTKPVTAAQLVKRVKAILWLGTGPQTE
jgi:two-component system, OmpR family, alkaline phosphatase synthesis response regulator PhoP